MPYLVALIAITLASCSGPLSTLDPAGPAAASIATLWWVMLAGAAGLLVLVMTLVLLGFTKPGIGTGVSLNAFLIAGGLALPGFILTALLVYALFVGERLLPLSGSLEPLRIQVTGQQWFWTFNYSHAGASRRSIGIMHIPVGRRVDVEVTSTDVIHSFWIPRLAGKIDATPGHTTVLRLMADRPGIYRGLCAEFCGTGHAGMDFVVQAHPESDYPAIIGQLTTSLVASPAMSSLSKRGP
jgi:cytochrome c oxidase subunit II